MTHHRVPARVSAKVVATLQDTICFDFSNLLLPGERAVEMESSQEFLRSPGQLVVSSCATLDALVRLFAIDRSRVSVIPYSAEHVRDAINAQFPAVLGETPYIFYPANTSLHKNHDLLIRSFANWTHCKEHPLVLTGNGTDLAAVPGTDRAAGLRRLAEVAGLRVGIDLVGLGFVDDDTCYSLLARAWALVMPTLAEGFGLPVGEAILAGVPVIASDIPVLREQVESLGAEILWIDPRDPITLAARLNELKRNYAQLKRRAVDQVHRLRRRSWADVASDYWKCFESAAVSANSQSS
jgi:glycosyltransferase involved in cell wall biosynthesis